MVSFFFLSLVITPRENYLLQNLEFIFENTKGRLIHMSDENLPKF